jgi:hypothetical protein
MGAVDVKHTAEEELTLEWSSSATSDMIADSIMAVIVGIDKSPASVKCVHIPLMIEAPVTRALKLTYSDHVLSLACAFARP